MTDKQKELLNELTEMSQELGLYECSYKGECHLMGCLDDKDCFIRQLFEERYSAERALYRKEQECERLKKRISNYKCPMNKNADYCGHLEDYGELLGQLDQLKADNEQLKNFHINLVGVKECEIRELAELKADNKHLNDLLNQALKELEEMRELKDTESLQACILTRENERLKELLAQDQCFQDRSHKCVKSFYIDERYKQAIEKIKEILLKTPTDSREHFLNAKSVILQICDEVNDV